MNDRNGARCLTMKPFTARVREHVAVGVAVTQAFVVRANPLFRTEAQETFTQCPVGSTAEACTIRTARR
jgi:hypothetical protein